MHFFSPALWPFLPILAGTRRSQDLYNNGWKPFAFGSTVHLHQFHSISSPTNSPTNFPLLLLLLASLFGVSEEFAAILARWAHDKPQGAASANFESSHWHWGVLATCNTNVYSRAFQRHADPCKPGSTGMEWEHWAPSSSFLAPVKHQSTKPNQFPTVLFSSASPTLEAKLGLLQTLNTLPLEIRPPARSQCFATAWSQEAAVNSFLFVHQINFQLPDPGYMWQVWPVPMGTTTTFSTFLNWKSWMPQWCYVCLFPVVWSNSPRPSQPKLISDFLDVFASISVANVEIWPW